MNKHLAFRRKQLARSKCPQTLTLLLIVTCVTAVAWLILQFSFKKQNGQQHVVRDQFPEGVSDLRQGIQSFEQLAGQQIPKVALLFLVMGPIPTEPIWTRFFQAAGNVQLQVTPDGQITLELFNKGQQPMSQYLGHPLYPEIEPDWQEIEKECWAHNDSWEIFFDPGQRDTKTQHQSLKYLHMIKKMGIGPQVIEEQNLFSVYVHNSPSFRGYPLKSIFYGHAVKDPIKATFAQHSLIEAERKLLQAALQDPLNTKFVLLSESCIPLYHPAFLYTQILNEQLSRLNSCKKGINLSRWSVLMQTPHFNISHWRKSSQWWTITRAHAKLFIKDKHIDSQMKSYCSTKHMCGNETRLRVCIGDESYTPTLLAAYHLQNETDCMGFSTRADWSEKTWHPREFESHDISTKLLMRLRHKNCYVGSLDSQFGLLFRMQDKDPQDEIELGFTPIWQDFRPIDYRCSLFARKFKQRTVDMLLQIADDCQGLQLSDECFRKLKRYQILRS
eukprot:TRINITY_DN799_c0_g1_i1.p1 TRINITY_DN799_c0_g1~~TRINITY_DN799_c0_g1_i1.p1  ORF type:complete len:501 (+),score=28.27 TRINITY_DN799_c0_g1_i1:147-1649(+)